MASCSALSWACCLLWVRFVADRVCTLCMATRCCCCVYVCVGGGVGLVAARRARLRDSRLFFHTMPWLRYDAGWSLLCCCCWWYYHCSLPGVTAAPRCAMDVVGVCATDALSSSCFPVGVVVLFVSLWTASVVRHLQLLERCPVAIECAVCAVPVWLLNFVVCACRLQVSWSLALAPLYARARDQHVPSQWRAPLLPAAVPLLDEGDDSGHGGDTCTL